MKKLLIIIALGAAFVVLAPKFGINLPFFGEPHPAEIAYQKFLDAWVTRDYKVAARFATGEALEEVKQSQKRTKMKFMGRTIDTPLAEKGLIHGSNIKVKSMQEEDGAIDYDVYYSASVTWGGVAATAASPKSWRHWESGAILVEEGGSWLVESFYIDATD